MSPSVPRFEPIRARLAELQIAGGDDPFTLTAAPSRYNAVHHLGFADAPLFAIEREPSPEEPWTITPLSGRSIRGAAELPDELRSWIPPPQADSLATLLSALPSGDYFLALHRGLGCDEPGVLLGNEWVPDPGAHHVVLHDRDRCYAGAVGANAGIPPDLSQPLLGISVLNFTGDPVPRAALFFPCLETEPDAGDGNEQLLVIPRSGPLVFDNMERFSAERSAEDKATWTREHAASFAGVLAGPDANDAK